MPPRMLRSVVCGMRKCHARFNDKESLLKHIDGEHKTLVFRGEDHEATPCPWKRCKFQCHVADTFHEHFLAVHINVLNIRARAIVRRSRKKGGEKCEYCWRKFANRLEVLWHHLRCHKEKIPKDQDKYWPDLIWYKKEWEETH